MHKKILIVLVILLGIFIALILIRSFLLACAFGIFDKDYSVSELKDNFNNKEPEIRELINYYNGIVPRNMNIEIELSKRKEIARISVTSKDRLQNVTDTPIFQDWNLKINTYKVDSLIQMLGWTHETLKMLRLRLKKANCIGISNGEPTKIDFKRSGMGMYSFNVFEKPISDSLKKQFNDSCTYIYVNDHLILEYGGGAIGPQCFYNLK